MKTGIGASRFKTAGELAEVLESNIEAQRERERSTKAMTAGDLKRSFGVHFGKVDPFKSERIKTEIFKGHLRSSFPGWLGKLVNHGHLCQALFRNHIQRWPHLNAEQLGPSKNGEPYLWVRSKIDFPPPIETPSWMIEQGHDDGWIFPTGTLFGTGEITGYNATKIKGGGVVQPIEPQRRWAEFFWRIPNERFDKGRFTHWRGWFHGDPDHEKIYKGITPRTKPLDLPPWRKLEPGEPWSTTEARYRAVNWHNNARWLVWAAEMWRLNSGWHERSLADESKYGPRGHFAKSPSRSDRQLLELWKRHCMTWLIGPAGRVRLNDPRLRLSGDRPFVPTEIRNDPSQWPKPLRPMKDPQNFTIPQILEKVMDVTGVPGTRTWGELEGTLCDWTDFEWDSFRPEWRFPQGWSTIIRARMLEAESKSAQVVFGMKVFDAGWKIVSAVLARMASEAFATFSNMVVTELSGRINALVGEFISTAYRYLQDASGIGDIWKVIENVGLTIRQNENFDKLMGDRRINTLKNRFANAADNGWRWGNDLFDDVISIPEARQKISVLTG